MMIKWKTVKSGAELKLKGCTIELEQVDGSMKGVTIRDDAGGIVRIWLDNGWSLGVAVPAPPETKDAWAVTGKVLGVTIDEVFGTEREADTRRDELTTGVSDEGDAKVKVERVKLADGKRVPEPKKEDPSDGIAF